MHVVKSDQATGDAVESSRLHLNVEMFGGAAIDAGCNDLVKLADKLGVVVTCKANGVELMAIPGVGDGSTLFKNWEAAMKSKVLHPCASSRAK